VSGESLGVALTAHWLPLDALLRLVRRADELGYAQILVDGDAALPEPLAPERPIHDPTALVAAALAHSRRARLGAIHLAAFWNAFLLARNLATLQELAGGRLVALFGVGAERSAARMGLPQPSARERVARLDELLGFVRPLLAGESVTRKGEYLSLERAGIAPPSRPVPIAVSAAGPRALDVVRRHADIWDANVPPLRERFEPVRARLERALPTWLWCFARPGAARDDAVGDYRRHVPWFRALSDDECARAMLWGDAARCRTRLGEIRAELGIALPIVDLAGLDEARAARALEVLAPRGAAASDG
jgi:alkanesulfonate monooxygenase SsuD/methylene tetrahydromethanopterin reductase-like flavin-dependent oxidoreductase (luciferase family)